LVGHERPEVTAARPQDTAAPGKGEGKRADGAARRCRCCGHFAAAAAACPYCGGDANALGDAPAPLRPGRGLWPLDLVHGVALFARGAVQVLHHRAFVHQLKVPIAANAIAFASFAALAWTILMPAFRSWFAGEWPLLDGWRAANAEVGPVRLLLASAWFLWPVWFDAIAGASVEPLADAAESAIAGPGMREPMPAGWRTTVDRLRLRARLFACQLLLLPAVWLCALLPVVGLPLSFLAASAAAAAVWCELPAARRGLDLRAHLLDLRRNWARALGFGAGCQLGLVLPFLNLLLLAPAAAVGATMLHFHFDKDGGATTPRAPRS
jgi:uncharacterized protein involved in cysteine biosynthesis